MSWAIVFCRWALDGCHGSDTEQGTVRRLRRGLSDEDQKSAEEFADDWFEQPIRYVADPIS